MFVQLKTALSIVLILLCGIVTNAEAKNRSVLIGYTKNSYDAERSLHGNRGRINKRFKYIKAVAAEVPEEALASLLSDENIAYIEEDFPVALIDAVEESSIEYDNSWGVKHIGAEAVHKLPVTGHGVKIAVLDTGIDPTHPELTANYSGGIDIVFGDEPLDDSWNSHGTHVAGIIAAAMDDEGVIGVAPDANLYAVKVLDGSGMGLASWFIGGLEWAVDNDMDVANISIGFSAYSQAMEEACNYAADNGVLLVAAAGNFSGGDVLYPAAFSSVIAVTGTDSLDQSGFFAPLGPEIELAAPGVGIYSTTRYGRYAYLSGTSQAAPHVTGAAALVIAAGLRDFNNDGAVTNDDIRFRLANTAIDLGLAGVDDEFGYGLVDLARAIEPTSDEEIISFVLDRKRRKPLPRENLTLEEGIYTINITNQSLRNIRILVRENGRIRWDLSTFSRLKRKKTIIEREISIDATNTSLNVTFLGIGKPGTSAEISILPAATYADNQ